MNDRFAYSKQNGLKYVQDSICVAGETDLDTFGNPWIFFIHFFIGLLSCSCFAPKMGGEAFFQS